MTTEKWPDLSPIPTGSRSGLGILFFFDHVLAFVGGLGLGDEAARGGERVHHIFQLAGSKTRIWEPEMMPHVF